MHKVVSVREPLVQYKWGANCDGYTLVDEEQLQVKLEQMPPGTLEEWHFHHRAQQFFYVLEGEALFEIEDERVAVLKGEGLLIEPLVKHRVLNTGDRNLKFMLCSQPSTQGDRVQIKTN
jgi:mannose-6-phosphate isomerase-like protein (cupin superfamily)